MTERGKREALRLLFARLLFLLSYKMEILLRNVKICNNGRKKGK